jgi:enterochelin esterase-like enzyme
MTTDEPRRMRWLVVLLFLLWPLAACHSLPLATPNTGDAVTILPAPPSVVAATAAVATPTRFDDPTATATTPPPTPQLPTPTPATEPLQPVAPPPTASPQAAPPTPEPTPCAAPGRIETGVYNTTLAGPLAYRVYLPPCYGEDGRVYPALYLLGGNIHDDRIWDALGADEAAEAGIATGVLSPFIIVMPDGGWVANQTSGGPGSFESVVMDELIPAVEQAYCLWPDRAGRAIGGLSRGGYWSLEIAFRHAPQFRSVGAHSPALIDSYAGPDLDPVYTGVANDLSDLRIWIDLGERDPYVVQARPLHDALAGAGVAHVWQLNPGTHDEVYWMSNVPAYLAWYNDGWAIDRSELPLCAGTN